ncbi:ABC transporter substrate-binding protein [Brumimicrobium aurantiacum]|uniref:Cobalamin-binding protein n=1 Tax=Brumimicrobium aurantiacum TaxID=1737063 RepID=A0A3E1EZ35_9FLAO|nr:helical backbone metal receptor [Brumimicrobium aurantiacum]RFC54808.1 cobalamin-binding protein [Brumimicrobium aurantiacum]
MIDQIGNKINLEKEPVRIVSLVPSQTELLFHLGLGDRVVGITKFCIHPNEWFRSKERIGGTKDVKIDKVAQLNPDLIIANKEENTKEDIEALQEIAPVYVSDIFNLEDSLEMITQVAELCNLASKGEEIKSAIRKNFSTIVPFLNKPKVAYLIWKNPYMGVGSDTFIDFVLSDCLQMENVLANQSRYPELNLETIPTLDYLFLSTEPYPFKEKHIEELQSDFPDTKIVLVDGEFFTWYGSRLINAPKYLNGLMKELIDD